MKKTLLFFTLVLWVFLGNAQTTQTVKLPLKLENVSLGSSKDSILVIGMDGIVRRVKTSSITGQDPTKLPLTGGSINGGLAVNGAFSNSFFEDEQYGDTIKFGYDRNYAAYVITGKDYPEAGNLYVGGNISTGGSVGATGILSGGTVFSQGRMNARSLEIRDANNNNWTLKYGSTGSLEFQNTSGKKAQINSDGAFQTSMEPFSPDDLVNKKYADALKYTLPEYLSVQSLTVKGYGGSFADLYNINGVTELRGTTADGTAMGTIYIDPSKPYPEYRTTNQGGYAEIYHSGRLAELKNSLGFLLESGGYNPTFDNLSSNIANITKNTAIYTRNGYTINVDVALTINTTDTLPGEFFISLPLPADIRKDTQITGFGFINESENITPIVVKRGSDVFRSSMVHFGATTKPISEPRTLIFRFSYTTHDNEDN